MKMKKEVIFNVLVLICCLALPMLALAQPGTQDPEDTPIDGGLSVLLAAGAAYGIKKYRDHKKEKGAEQDVNIK